MELPPSPLPLREQRLTQYRAAYYEQKLKIEETESQLRGYYNDITKRERLKIREAP